MVREVAGEKIQQQQLAAEELHGAFHGAVRAHVGKVQMRFGGQRAFALAQVVHQRVEGNAVGDADQDAHVHPVRALKNHVEKTAGRLLHFDPVARRHKAEQAGGVHVAGIVHSGFDIGHVALAGGGLLGGAGLQAARHIARIHHQRNQRGGGKQHEHQAQTLAGGILAQVGLALAPFRAGGIGGKGIPAGRGGRISGHVRTSSHSRAASSNRRNIPRAVPRRGARRW